MLEMEVSAVWTCAYWAGGRRGGRQERAERNVELAASGAAQLTSPRLTTGSTLPYYVEHETVPSPSSNDDDDDDVCIFLFARKQYTTRSLVSPKSEGALHVVLWCSERDIGFGWLTRNIVNDVVVAAARVVIGWS